ncbi:hypothetical protein [Pseudomonas sp. B22129]|uniref:hypothetical protein n=1 Tax=Pseudomonas sp. B22129 TaxID=3235111 RepID=UPI0037852617
MINGFKKFYFAFTSSALFSSIAVLATVVVGAYISLYSTTITGQFDKICLPILKPCGKGAYPEISIAIILMLLLAAVLLTRELSVAHENNSARNKLQDIIKNTPSKSFLEHYTTLMRLIGTYRLEIKKAVKADNPNIEEIHNYIRSCLHGIISLAKYWDGNDGRSYIYRANIMTMVPSDYFNPVSISDDFLKKVVDITDSGKLFLYNSSLLTKARMCSGVLILENNSFTVSTNVAFGEIDDSIQKPICFPYTDQNYNGSKNQPIIPGAPACASFGAAQYLNDTGKEIETFLKNTQHKNREFCDRFKSDVNEYYNSIDEAQSILSIPIQRRIKDDFDPSIPLPLQYETIAVLNIYRNRTGIFRDIDSAMSFAQLMEPICYHFAKMLESIAEVEPDE